MRAKKAIRKEEQCDRVTRQERQSVHDERDDPCEECLERDNQEEPATDAKFAVHNGDGSGTRRIKKDKDEERDRGRRRQELMKRICERHARS